MIEIFLAVMGADDAKLTPMPLVALPVPESLLTPRMFTFSVAVSEPPTAIPAAAPVLNPKPCSMAPVVVLIVPAVLSKLMLVPFMAADVLIEPLVVFK